MELREFAERILFARSLEEKLARPDSRITDEHPGPPILPDAPGRPNELRFQLRGGGAALPARHEIEDEQHRGRLLHFFANHELLATELMALVLLKFPNAPAEFRRGVYETLREEQRHTGWYVKRLEQCGLSFGDHPVSGYFWRAVSPMETPLDYVSRLSLTFEQANLDFSRHFAEVFRSSGDEASAAILERIYRDEISHVNYGLTWFRRWKDPALSDWEAWERQLPFPLSPSRARASSAGMVFNQEGRTQAGFDPEFIQHLRIFERSRGRTPRVFWFHPDAENHMADPGYTANAAVLSLARDLDILPAFLASREDVVLVEKQPTVEHRQHLMDLGFQLPEFEALQDGKLATDSLIRERKLGGLRPWAWSPRALQLFRPLLSNLADAPAPGHCWNDARRQLFSKATDHELAATLDEHPEVTGGVARTMDEVLALVSQFPVAVLKAPFGMSAQRNQVWKGDEKWARQVLNSQGAVVVEPWLERVMDFSLQYEMEPEGLRWLGLVRLVNDRRGQFRAVQAGLKPAQGLAAPVARRLGAATLDFYRGKVREALEDHLQKAAYLGPVGVDAFLYRGVGGEVKLRAICEINPRYTMGRLAWELQRRVAAGHCVRFEILPKTAEVREFAICGGSPARLQRGMVILNDPARAERVLGVLHVGQNQQSLWEPGDNE